VRFVVWVGGGIYRLYWEGVRNNYGLMGWVMGLLWQSGRVLALI
jgi:hypothetical protein